ncbi:MAG: ribosome-binding factor A [Candidatus Dependentiae bacterium ADurb.Bin331]|nr:MAG: ribosome-binding factor A [Candidatus Dependentiae bacterium ADurb.Bin331]
MTIFESKRVRDIKKAQKEKLLFRELSQLFLQATIDDSRLRDVYVNRVALSADKSICFIYFYSPQGPAFFEEKLDILKLYKPSLRKAIAEKIDARYTPDLVFKYDEQYEKIEKMENLFEQIKKSDK